MVIDRWILVDIEVALVEIFLWGGAGGQGPDMRAEGQGADNPNTQFIQLKTFLHNIKLLVFVN